MTDLNTKFLYHFSKLQEEVTHFHMRFNMGLYSEEQANRKLKKARDKFVAATEESPDNTEQSTK